MEQKGTDAWILEATTQTVFKMLEHNMAGIEIEIFCEAEAPGVGEVRS